MKSPLRQATDGLAINARSRVAYFVASLALVVTADALRPGPLSQLTQVNEDFFERFGRPGLIGSTLGFADQIGIVTAMALATDLLFVETTIAPTYVAAGLLKSNTSFARMVRLSAGSGSDPS